MTAETSPIDLRSDTVTRPTEAMYERMRRAPIGDDSLDRDPTAVALEEAAAAVLGKEAGLFTPTCTMANLLAVLVHVKRAEQIYLDAASHILNTERGTAIFTAATMRPLPSTRGEMDPEALAEAIALDRGKARGALVCLETSHNAAGGLVPPLAYMHRIRTVAAGQGMPVHLDGARLFNAAVALDVAPAEIAARCDSVSICLSKGLSAPAGAVLAGSAEVIARARALRKLLGGTQRQIGVLAAAGLEGLEVMRHDLGRDHDSARVFSEAVNAGAAGLCASAPQTNIVQIELAGTGRTSAQWVTALETAGVLVRPAGPRALRCVTHRHITAQDARRAGELVCEVAIQQRA